MIQFRRDHNRHILHVRRRPPFTINFVVPWVRYRGQQYPRALTELPRPTGVPGRIRPDCEESGIRDTRSRTPRVDRCAVVTSSHSCQEAAWHEGVASVASTLWYSVGVSRIAERAVYTYKCNVIRPSINIALASDLRQIICSELSLFSLMKRKENWCETLAWNAITTLIYILS